MSDTSYPVSQAATAAVQAEATYNAGLLDRRMAEHMQYHMLQDTWQDKLRESHALAHIDQHRADEKAIGKATEQLNQRLEGMNEFRDQLREQATTFMRIDTYTQAHITLENRVEALGDSLEAKIDALTAHNTERIAVLEKAQFTLAGRQGGASQTIIWIFGGLAALSTTLTIIILIATKFLNG